MDDYSLKAGQGTFISHNESDAIREKMTGVEWWDDLVTIGTLFKIDKHCDAASMSYIYILQFLIPEGEETLFAMRHGAIPNLRIIPTHITLQEWTDQQHRRVSTR